MAPKLRSDAQRHDSDNNNNNLHRENLVDDDASEFHDTSSRADNLGPSSRVVMMIDDSKYMFHGAMLTRVAWEQYQPTFKAYLRKRGPSHLLDLIPIRMHTIVALRVKRPLDAIEKLSSEELNKLIIASLLPSDAHEVISILKGIQWKMTTVDDITPSFFEYTLEYDALLSPLPEHLKPTDKTLVKLYVGGIRDAVVRNLLYEEGADTYSELKEMALAVVEKVASARKLLRQPVVNQHNGTSAPGPRVSSPPPSKRVEFSQRGTPPGTQGQAKERANRDAMAAGTPPTQSIAATSSANRDATGVVCGGCGWPKHDRSTCRLTSHPEYNKSGPWRGGPPLRRSSVNLISKNQCNPTGEECRENGPLIPIKVGSVLVEALLDTGSSINGISKKTLEEILPGSASESLTNSTRITLRAANGSCMNSLGRVSLSIIAEGKSMNLFFEVFETLTVPMILGYGTICVHKLWNLLTPAGGGSPTVQSISLSDQIAYPQEIQRVLSAFPKVLSSALPPEPAKVPPLIVRLRDGVILPKYQPPRITSPAREKVMRGLLEEMLKLNIIEEVSTTELRRTEIGGSRWITKQSTRYWSHTHGQWRMPRNPYEP
jgi:hypothetical protein